MLYVVSPAKNLDYDTPAQTETHTQPELVEQAAELAQVCRTLTPADLSKLMGISDKLAGLNAARFEQWVPEFTLANSKQAVLAFNGDVYAGMEAQNFSEQELNYAQTHLRILSGLYGLLKPLDLMQPYRLEMGTKLETDKGQNLYQFWDRMLTDEIQSEKPDAVINLASTEYSSAVKFKQLDMPVITIQFRQLKEGKLKNIGLMAKRARGMMADWIIKNKITCKCVYILCYISFSKHNRIGFYSRNMP